MTDGRAREVEVVQGLHGREPGRLHAAVGCLPFPFEQLQLAELQQVGQVVDVVGRGLAGHLFALYWPGHHAYGASAYVAAGSSHQVVVITDPAKRLAQVTLDGATDLSTILIDGEPIYADSQDTASTGSPPAIGAVNTTVSSPQPTLCQSLNH
ncbi:MAG TPA: hypothetical protein VFC03_09540 [Acidimicrobiales bacterium]|nr:hypothetical protein [Acidimicrobiales bacterium]